MKKKNAGRTLWWGETAGYSAEEILFFQRNWFVPRSVTLPTLSTPRVSPSFSAKSAENDPRVPSAERNEILETGSRWRSCWRVWQTARFLNRKQTFSATPLFHRPALLIACSGHGLNFYRTLRPDRPVNWTFAVYNYVPLGDPLSTRSLLSPPVDSPGGFSRFCSRKFDFPLAREPTLSEPAVRFAADLHRDSSRVSFEIRPRNLWTSFSRVRTPIDV